MGVKKQINEEEKHAASASFVFIALDRLFLLPQTFLWYECNQLLTNMHQMFRVEVRPGGGVTAVQTQRSRTAMHFAPR